MRGINGSPFLLDRPSLRIHVARGSEGDVGDRELTIAMHKSRGQNREVVFESGFSAQGRDWKIADVMSLWKWCCFVISSASTPSTLLIRLDMPYKLSYLSNTLSKESSLAQIRPSSPETCHRGGKVIGTFGERMEDWQWVTIREIDLHRILAVWAECSSLAVREDVGATYEGGYKAI
ncbi:hypothetical protein BJ508DRAFT_47122 [Ascobolus immersus RN42]|uniref:Uncharacterized protein n=1 Tax=Ascobolus immersus RN42 TaxID=1160509 RepID=A0A3N4IE23_ASCIM|nr:hypothetical protein BJ508DRAFT_47122 [Ascobolus immersus RN42]